MKKFLLTLALTVMCAFGLTACGETEQAEIPISNTDAEQVAESTISIINQVVLAEQVDDYVDQFTSYYGEDAGDAAPLMAGAMVKSAAAPMDMTVRVTARDGLTLTCTVEDAGTGGFQPGQTVTVLLPEEAEGIPERIRIFYITENEDGTIPALSWEEVVP